MHPAFFDARENPLLAPDAAARLGYFKSPTLAARSQRAFRADGEFVVIRLPFVDGAIEGFHAVISDPLRFESVLFALLYRSGTRFAFSF